jgi:hypothetical protein
MDEISNISTIISSALAPVVMISACGLLLLGLQSKYSNITDRIRQLDHEKLELEQREKLTTWMRNRLRILTYQIHRLLTRVRLVRDAIFLLYVAILFFVGASLLALLSNIIALFSAWFIFAIFVAGLICVLASGIFVMLEVYISYDVIRSQVQADYKARKSLLFIPEEFLGIFGDKEEGDLEKMDKD